jgi:dCMP deaminase
MNRPDKDIVFMTAAFLFAQLSPDAQTKHGAILVDKNNRLLGQGFNGFPRGLKDQDLPNTRENDKYFFMLHSEENAILNARIIPEPESCTLYVTGPCCHECTKKIIQAGIGKVVYSKKGSACMKTDPDYSNKMKLLLKHAKVQFVEFDSNNTKLADMFELLDNVKTDINLVYR